MRGRLRRLVWAIALVGAALGVQAARKAFIHSFFAPIAPPAAPPVLTGTDGDGLTNANDVRIYLIDGLRRDRARTLPALNALCARGLDLTVDVGFPAVSLPVQHVLWTGLTQQQSGVLYNTIGSLKPGFDIPSQVPGSVAVAQAHKEIVSSFGFARLVFPPREDFADDAVREVASDARLVFVHFLEVDAMGHKHGGTSAAYRAAAEQADALLARMLAARDASPETRWIVLADHGHLDVGGHAGDEPVVRLVRACIAGGPPLSAQAGAIHMIDLARAIADSLGVKLAPGAVGRPLHAALAHPIPDATLPRFTKLRTTFAILIVLAALAVSLRFPWKLWPFWYPIAVLAYVVQHGVPSLSSEMTYAPRGLAFSMAALPGLVVLVVAATVSLKKERPWRVVLSQLVLPIGCAVAALILAGEIATLLGGPPPLMPYASSAASFALALTAAAAEALALPLLASAVLPGFDRS